MVFVFKEYAAKIQGKYACALVEAKGNQKRKAMMFESLQYFCKNSHARNNSHYFRHTNAGQHSRCVWPVYRIVVEQSRSWDQGQVGADENDVDGKLFDGAGQVGVQIQVGHHSGDIV